MHLPLRLFVAIPVPSALHPAVSRAAGPLRDCLGVRLILPGSYHLTLRFIGDTDEEKARRIGEALSAVAFTPFSVRLFGAGAYPDVHFPRAIFIGGKSKGAEALSAEIGKALLPFSLPKEKFSVHLTVARSKGAGDIDLFLKETGEVGQFEARFFVLMKSILLPQGASYEVLREYPAQG